MTATLKELIRCPKCGGREIVYSCEPKCCFNHVCADCRSTFEINTHKTGRFDREAAREFSEPLSGEPTTGCAACDSLGLAVLSTSEQETLLLCGRCRAVLTLAIEEFVPGQF
jgi:DNA-directed RNA polymerase subunit RPC12/RpoP